MLEFLLICSALLLGWHLHDLWIQIQGKIAVMEAAYYAQEMD